MRTQLCHGGGGVGRGLRVRRGVPGELFTVLFAIAPGTQRYTYEPTRMYKKTPRVEALRFSLG